MQITSLVEARRQEDQGLNHLFNSILCISGLEYRNQHGGISTSSSLEFVYQYCHMGTGTVREWYRTDTLVLVRLGIRIGTIIRVTVRSDTSIGTGYLVPVRVA
ncbi:hypothetical protein V6N13_029832 [Hibiscus sabdariffa]